jgi:hypothetical protein
MGITETLIVYGIIGSSVAGAIWLSDKESSALVAMVHMLLWPLFAPMLFEPRASEPGRPVARPTDERADPRLTEVERALMDALETLDGAPEDVLRPEVERVRSLMDSLDDMARRRDDMESMLDEPQFDRERATAVLCELDASDMPDEAHRESVRNRIRHIERLETMHASLSRDIERTLLKLEEMTSQIRLLRFADSPAEEVSNLVRDITSTVEGLSEGLMTSQT